MIGADLWVRPDVSISFLHSAERIRMSLRINLLWPFVNKVVYLFGRGGGNGVAMVEYPDTFVGGDTWLLGQ